MSALNTDLVYLRNGEGGRKEVLAYGTTKGHPNKWTIYKLASQTDRLISQIIDNPNDSATIVSSGMPKNGSQVAAFLKDAEATKTKAYIEYSEWIKRIDGMKPADKSTTTTQSESTRSANGSAAKVPKVDTAAKAPLRKGNGSG